MSSVGGKHPHYITTHLIKDGTAFTLGEIGQVLEHCILTGRQFAGTLNTEGVWTISEVNRRSHGHVPSAA